MARLNEPIMATESLETLRRKFLRQNRDIARINSTQSLRIRGLENECARMLSENLDLRGQILRLETELSESRAQRIADHALEIKEKMEAQLLEWGTMLASLGHEPIPRHQSPRLPKKAKTRSSIGMCSSPRWRRRNTEEMEWAAQQEGRLPPLWENKYCPRETLNREEIMALCEEAAEEANDSPDLGPPPVSRFVDEDPVKIDLPTKSPSAIRDMYALEDSPSAPARKNLVEVQAVAVKKVQTLESIEKAEEAQMSSDEREETMGSDPAPAIESTEPAQPTKKPEPTTIKPTATPEPPSNSQTAKAGLKRKASDEDEKENMQHPQKREDAAKAVKAAKVQLGKPNTKEGVTNRPIKSLPPVRRDVQGTPANPVAITATRTPLSARNANEPVISPRKSTKPGLPGDIVKAKPATKREEQSKERPMKAPEEQPIAPVVATIDSEAETMSAEPDLFAPSSPEPPVAPREHLRDTPPPTEISNDGETSRPSRRNRTAVSYAEPNLRDKMRRPTKQLLDAVAGEGKVVRRTSQSKQSGDLLSVKSEEKSQLWKELPSAPPSSAASDIAASPLVQKMSRSPPSAVLPMSVVTDRKKRSSMAAREADVVKLDVEENDSGDVYDFPDVSPRTDLKRSALEEGKKSLKSRTGKSEKATAARSSNSRKRASMMAPKTMKMIDSENIDGDSSNSLSSISSDADKAWHHLLALLGPARRVGAGGGARVDEELVHVLEGVEAVGAAPAEDVDVKLVGLGQQQVGLRRHEREALDEAHAQRAVRHHLRERQGGGLDVEPAFDDLQVRGDGPQVLVRVLVGQVAEAEGLADLAGGEELLELLRDANIRHWLRSATKRVGKMMPYLGGYVEGAVRDVKIANDEN
ncbi:hypothetical protein PG988_005820 [Apiospora saccharicola]